MVNIVETTLTPYAVSRLDPVAAILVLAPHPDDEIFGPGGTLALHAQRGDAITVILATNGECHPERGSDMAYGAARVQESNRALALLRLPAAVCWGLPDRGITYGEALVERIIAALTHASAEWVYAPSLWENHPDHRALAMAAVEAVRRLGGTRQTLQLVFYEVSAPLRPNRLIDISAVAERKQQAMAAFTSQNALHAYAECMKALARYRTLTLPATVVAAEAFECYSAAELSAGAFSLHESEHSRRVWRDIPAEPTDLPLVSVLVRTMGRPSLARTLDSIAAQTYSNLEVVLIDVRGQGIAADYRRCGPYPLQLVENAVPLARASAANAGLDRANGAWLIFLDDDDWFYPDHLAKLVATVVKHPEVRAVHTGVECVDDAGQPTGSRFEIPYVDKELRFGNFLPIHAVLFSRQLLAAGCRFDANFDLYEDWDFWLQVEAHTRFQYVPGISAAYRVNLASGLGVRVDQAHAEAVTATLRQKWQHLFDAGTFAQLISRALELRQLQPHLAVVEAARHASDTSAVAALAAANQARLDAHALRSAHDAACADRERTQGRLDQTRSILEQVQARHEQVVLECERYRGEVRAQETRGDHFQAAHTEACADRERTQIRLEQTLRILEQVQARHEQVVAECERYRGEVRAQEARGDHFEAAHAEACTDRDVLQAAHVLLQADHAALQADHAALQADHAAVQADHAAQEAALFGQIRHWQGQLDMSQRQVTTLLASTSWQLTRPLRWATTLWRGYRIVHRAGMPLNVMTQRSLSLWRQGGLRAIYRRLQNRLQLTAAPPVGGTLAPVASQPTPGTVVEVSHAAARTYTEWVASFDTLTPEIERHIQAKTAALPRLPTLSIIMPVYNTPALFLEKAIASVRAQLYPYWELCIADDASTAPHVREVLDRHAAADQRIKVLYRPVNGHIVHATNSALTLVTGEYVAFLDHDDELRSHALSLVVLAIDAHPAARLFYSDEDKVDAAELRFQPYFKPDFNLGLLRSHNFICHFSVYANSLLQELGGLRDGFAGAQDYDLVLRAVDAVPAAQIHHIPHVLYHWRACETSTATRHDIKNYASIAARRALDEHLQRRQVAAVAEDAIEAPGAYRLRYTLPAQPPRVSILIPTRNRLDLLARCIDTLHALTRYPNYEIIVIDNGSDEPATLDYLANAQTAGRLRVLRDDGPFNFSALNNRAAHALAEAADGFLLLLNNDIEITHGEWLDEMVGPALEAGVGCVGARLWYPDGRLQHGGAIMVCGVAGHAHKYLPRGQHGYMGRAVLAQDFLAVTAACLLVRKSIFAEVGGFDEGLSVAFNDVDFCLRVWRAGYRNYWTPHAELVHHESLSRGHEDTPEKQQRFRAETLRMQERWGDLLKNDPCYNPNLTWESEDFSMAWPPRASLI